MAKRIPIARRKVKSLVECDECSATGLYQSSVEEFRTATICTKCDGTGCIKLAYMEFVARRKKRRGTIERVIWAQGRSILSDDDAFVTYDQFYGGKLPPRPVPPKGRR